MGLSHKIHNYSKNKNKKINSSDIPNYVMKHMSVFTYYTVNKSFAQVQTNLIGYSEVLLSFEYHFCDDISF